MLTHGRTLCDEHGEFDCLQFRAMIESEMRRYALRELSTAMNEGDKQIAQMCFVLKLLAISVDNIQDSLASHPTTPLLPPQFERRPSGAVVRVPSSGHGTDAPKLQAVHSANCIFVNKGTDVRLCVPLSKRGIYALAKEASQHATRELSAFSYPCEPQSLSAGAGAGAGRQHEAGAGGRQNGGKTESEGGAIESEGWQAQMLKSNRFSTSI